MKSIVLIARVIAIFIVALFILRFAASAPRPMPGPPDLPIDAATEGVVVDNLLKALNEGYIFPDIAKKTETDIRTRYKNKEYDAITSSNAFAKKLTGDLQNVSRDKHIRLFFVATASSDRKMTDAEKAAASASRKRSNYGFTKVER